MRSILIEAAGPCAVWPISTSPATTAGIFDNSPIAASAMAPAQSAFFIR